MTDTSAASERAKSPDAIEHDVDVERSQVARTIDALQGKMTVGAIADEIVGSGYGRRFSQRLGRSISENPLPIVLTCIGLAWLLMSSGAIRRADGKNDRGDENRPVPDDAHAARRPSLPMTSPAAARRG